MKGTYTGIDYAHFKGIWELKYVSDMSRYLLKISDISIKSKERKLKTKIERVGKLKQAECYIHG